MKKAIVLGIILIILISPVIAADPGKLTVNFQDGTSTTVDGYWPGNNQNGAIHYDVQGSSKIISASLFIDGQTIPWNGKNGAEWAGVPDGYNSASWHWIYTGKILTISHVTGTDPKPPSNETNETNETKNETINKTITDPGTKTIPMQTTGANLIPLILGGLLVTAGIVKKLI